MRRIVDIIVSRDGRVHAAITSGVSATPTNLSRWVKKLNQ
jgi:hypothetical protein